MSDDRSSFDANAQGHGATATDGEPKSEHDQIVAWLTLAMTVHRGDAYPGKRESSRYREDLELEASFHPDSDHAPMLATMHNISEEGLAVWVRSEVDPGKTLFIREFGRDDAPWVSTHVTHCTRGIRGYIIGTEFTNPVEDFTPPQPEGADGADDAEEHDEEKPKGLLGWLGLK